VQSHMLAYQASHWQTCVTLRATAYTNNMGGCEVWKSGCGEKGSVKV
jgi:hypothetical protein